MKFSEFLIEEAKKRKTGKMLHLSHPEDLHVEEGHEGYQHAVNHLHGLHLKLKNPDKKDLILNGKHDGSPSLVFGYHPENGKFFVGTKSVFNQAPKINHTHEDIERNHSTDPKLRKKLHVALEHLPKVTPKGSVYQGDMMHTSDSVKDDGDSWSFTPNTLTYSVKKKSQEGGKIPPSKIGIVPNVKYTGKKLSEMNAHLNTDTKDFNSHPDVHLINPQGEFDLGKAKYSHTIEKAFEKHMENAQKCYDDYLKGNDKLGSVNKELLKTYLNHTVRNGTTPNIEGYKAHIFDKLGNQKIQRELHSSHTEANPELYKSIFDIHNHLRAAKNTLMGALEPTSEYKHSIAGKPSGPEGYVVSHKGKITKFVNREKGGFSFSNFQTSKNRKV